MQHAIGDHALLADGRTAALVDPDGNVAWLCWPRFDSAACLLSLLDEERGGRFSVRPSGDGWRVVERGYEDGALVLRSVWRRGDAECVVRDALSWDEPQALLRSITARWNACDVEVVFRAVADYGASAATHTCDGVHLAVQCGSEHLTVTSPGAWTRESGTAVSRFVLHEGGTAVVSLHKDAAPPADATALQRTVERWREVLQQLHTSPSQLAEQELGTDEWGRLVRTSCAVLLGLMHRRGGVVAAPTTSLPQWPRTSRTWDYRYSWLRDNALGAIALWRAGFHDAAHRIGAFLGSVVEEHGAGTTVARVDGTTSPDERVLEHLSGYRGARPVRTGNAAAQQLQLDVPAELMELGWTLAAHHALPAALRAALPRCADWMAQRWSEPDSGIWEIRGPRRAYTHSRVMVSAALAGAADLAERGVIRGDTERWHAAATAARDAVLRQPGALPLHNEGGGADSALALLAHVGFLQAHEERNRLTLQLIEHRLDRNGLLDRHEAPADPSAEPCAPFLFPTFWMAEALAAAGMDGAARHFSSAVRARSPLGLFAEVADPQTLTPLGNYPHVQSHAAFLLAACS